MCTVTYIPNKDGFFLTSSRDEKSSRKTLPPMYYVYNGIELIYPKDEHAGGTWIAASKNGRVVCLLNGAFLNHKKKATYEKSRGIVLLECFNFDSIINFISETSFENIEPFTLLVLDYNNKVNNFSEFRWDGNNKHLKELDTKQQQIWSSVTLYSPDIQKERIKLFKNWMNHNSDEYDESIINFHNRKHGLSDGDDILMKSEGDLRTISISQVIFTSNKHEFKYYDLENTMHYNTSLTLNINEKV